MPFEPDSGAGRASGGGRFVPDAPAADSNRTAWQTTKDLSASALLGLTGVSKVPAMLLDKGITGQWVGPGVEAISEFESSINEQKSPQLRAKEQAMQQRTAAAGKEAEKWAGGGDGFGATAARILAEFGVGAYEAVKDPALLSAQLAQQVPMLGASRLGGLAADAAARGVAAAAPALAASRIGQAAVGAAGTAGAIGAGAALQGADIGTDAYQRLMALPASQWAQVEGFNDLAAEIGVEAAKSRMASSKAMTAAVQAGLASVLSTALPGGASVERALVGKGLGGASIPKAIGKAFVGEAVQEGVEEGYGALAANAAVQQVDPATRLSENVGGAAGQGAVLGGLMGGGAGGVQAVKQLREGADKTTPDVAPPAAAGAPQGAINADEVLGADPPNPAEVALRKPRPITALDRVAEIDRQLQDTPDDPALVAERLDLSKDWPKTLPGNPTKISTEAGATVEGRYALIEAADAQPSHDVDLRPNPAYPAELQPRDRARAASEAQIASIVGRLDPARLGLSQTAADGAPIIGEDGLVESGNARTIALQRIYRANGLKADTYRTWLRDNASQFGLDPSQVEGMQQPVLVRVRETPVDRAEFARQSNAPTVAAMSPLEQARADAARIDSMDDLRPDESGDFATSRDFIRRFVGRLPATERAGLIDSRGALSAPGYARVRNAVLAKAYGESPVLGRMVESNDDNLRNVSKALMLAAPRVAKARSAIDAGHLHDADITPHLVSAVEALGQIKDSGGSVADALAQADLTGDKFTPETRELVQFLADNARSPRRMAEFVTAYFDALEAMGDPNQGSLLGETAAPTTGELLTGVSRATKGAANADAENAGRGYVGEAAPGSGSVPGQPADAPGNRRGNQDAQAAAPVAANEPVDGDWQAFGPETGTLGVPRAQMPQVRVAKRAALLDFLEGRGIGHQRVDLPADTLKPTQAEYSRTKTDSAAHMVDERTDRAAVLVSSDGYVLDGHHRWLARAEAHAPVHAIQFDAPIGRLLDAVMQFPDTHVSTESAGAVTPNPRDLALTDIKDALGELGDFLTQHMRAAFTEEDKRRLMPILVKLYDGVIRAVGYEVKRVMAAAREKLRANKDALPGWNKIPAAWHREAIDKAVASLQERGQQTGLFSEAEFAQADLFSAPAAAPAVAMIDGRPYDFDRDNFKPPRVAEFLSKDEIAHADGLVSRYYTNRQPPAISAEDRARAEALLAPLIERAKADKAVYDQKIIDIAARTGALGQMIPPVVKGIKRAAEKLVVEENFNVDGMKDMLRSTIVVKSYADAQRVLDEIAAEFKLLRAPKNRTGGTALTLNGQALAAQDPAQFGGYTDLMVNIRMPSGVIAEIQVNVPEMLGAKEEHGHKLYEAAREAPKDSPLGVEIIRAMRGFYDPVSAAAQRRLSAAAASKPAGSVENVMPPLGAPARPGAMAGRGSSVEPSSDSLNQPLPGSSANQSPPNVGTNSAPSGNLKGALIASTPPIVPEKGENPYTTGKGKSSNVDADANDREGDAGSRPGAARAVEGAGQADVLPAGDGGRGQQPGGERVGADTGSGEPAVPPEGRNDERAGRGGKGKRARRGAAVPAGRDLKPKSGLNYRFTDDDISPPGSWAKRAAANVQAVELVKKLDAEKRQATPEEQRVLARFVGWGASDLAQNLFSSKLDKLDDVLQQYEEAVKAFEKRGNRPMVPDRYNSYVEGRYAAFSVLNYAAGGKLDYYRTTEITREQLDKAAPKKSDRAWLELRNRLRAVMTEDELAEASRSTQYGHYTSAGVVRGMWRALERFGFKGGLVLEPGAGKGNFPGLMPDALAANSSYTGIEYDSITGAILRQLFPDENTRTESYIDTKLPRDFYDVGIGNPPFAGLSVLADPEYKRNAFKLHDYFFAKTIDRVRPGGMVVFVTSRFTMDKQGDKARAYLAERADLVGAIRLPQTAFKENAGTEVVTDVLFLRKKVPGEVFEHGQDWLKSVPVDVAGKPESINEYFAAHPEMILGTPSRAGKMYSKDEYTVEAPDGEIADLFNAAVDRLPPDVMTPARGSAGEAAVVRELDFNPKAKKEGNYYVNDKGIVMQREGGVGVAVQLPKADEAIVRSFVPLRDALKQAQHDQLNDGDWEASLAALQAAYKAFTDAHGRINQFKLRNVNVKVDVLDDDGVPTGAKVAAVEERPVYPIATALQDDPEFTLVRALEDVNEDTGEIKPSDFLNKRVLGAPRKVEATTPHDAMLSVLNDTGKVDIGEIADRLDMDEADVIAALGSAVYRNPQGGAWETADEYLSGDVVKKLALAEAAAKTDPAYERNIEPLRAARPPAKSPANIDLAIGMNWIPGSVYEQFLRETAGVKARVVWNDATRQWAVSFTDTKGVRSHQRPAAVEEWGTAHRHAGELLEHALTGRPVMIRNDVRTPEGGTKSVANPAAIEAANEKLEKLKAEFSKWIWRDTERSDFLVRTYNDQFNTIAPRTFDGRHLTLPGTSALFNVFDHVKRGAWRIIQSGNTYLAHAVGSGKTFEMVISAMEQKRLGLIKKPMMVVPNHMLRQFASEWMQLYPAARLMVADENAFHKDKRRQFVSRVALSDLDGVIITHSAFKLLDMDPAYRAKIVEEQLDQLRAALENVDEEDGRSPRVKQIEKRIETLEQKLVAAQKAASKDQNARFDELGVDMLYVDEAHLYRKLDFGTARQVKGISSEGSDAALDLYVKTRWLEDKHPGRSLVMASGTPITNTLAELYSVQRYLGRQALIDKGIEDFDSWAAMFGREKTALEANASGKYEPVTRFSEFVNVPGLIQMFKQFADVLTADNLAALLGDKRPKVQGGARQIIVTPKTTRYRHYQRSLAARVEASRKWKPSKDEPNNPDPMIRIIGDGRLAAIDMRFVSPHAPSDPNSKLNKMIDDVIAAYRETADMEFTDKKTGKVEPNKGATMMVFSDLGFGEGVAANRGFNARAWFEKRLRDAGVPAAHVAFMGDYKKASEKLRLFQDMNAGRKRILVGSSKNMGTGVNAQQRLLDLFHLDSPWFPADLEQREGRIVRQGNKNKEVRLRAYVAKGSYDSTMWDMLARKGFFIDQALQGDPNIDRIEDLDSVSQYALASAMAAGDPRVLQLAGMRADIEKGNRLWQAHEDQRQRFKQRYNWAEHTVAASRALLVDADAAAAKVTDLSGDKFTAVVDGKTYTERKAWGQALKDAARYAASGVEKSQVIGDVSGFPVRFASVRTDTSFEWSVVLQTPNPAVLISTGDEDPVQLAISATRAVSDVVRLPATLRDRIAASEAEMDALRTRLETPFPMADMLATKQREAAALEAEIASSSKDRAWRVERTDTGMFLTVMAHNEETAVDKGMGQLGGEPEVWSAVELDQVREYDDEESTLAAALGSIGPEAGYGTRLSRGAVGGIAVPALQSVASRVASRLKGLPQVHVLASPADAPPALRAFIEGRGATADVEGALHDGAIYLFASGIEDETRAEHVLAEHEAAHAGLAAMLGTGRAQAMQALYNQNAEIRRAAKPMIDAGMALAEAVEEVIVEIPSAQLARLKGWRLLVGKVRDALARMGFERLAAQVDGWLAGNLTEQQRADLAVADLVRAARGFVAKQRTATIADDAAAQTAWLAKEAKARGFSDVDDLAARNMALFEKLAETWRRKHPAAAMLSVAATAGPIPPAPPAQPPNSADVRAEKIIQTAAGTPKPLDALGRVLTRFTGLERAAAFAYDKGGRLIDLLTPEVVKAGVVSDYGVPEAVIDRRAVMTGRQRGQLRQAGALLEKLAGMTRAESRVAYEWMTGEDPRTADELMQALPAESVGVLREIRTMVDDLSKEAVRLGQLDAEAFKRHRFAYLRRSYFKHAQELTGAEKAGRARAISILGDQYKGRGIVKAATMKQIQAIAPEWWKRKLVPGKADPSLKGEKFERLERRAPAGAGTAPLAGVDPGGQAKPKVLEVHYWPASEPKPARYADWDSTGVFEVTGTKGGDLTLWRDFTKAEREQMGEIDEARYAIAKTLQRMVHDVEVGRYLEWLSQNHAKLPGEAIDGTLVEPGRNLESYRTVFKPGEWVRVPDTKIAGTSVHKYGKLAGQYLPGPIWNDLRQVVGGQFMPLGETYHHIQRAWKASKTALSPVVHTNNVMSNFVMADWHDVSSGHVAKALRIVLAAGDGKGKGALGRAGNVAGQLGIADREAARAILARYQDSGGAIGGWVTQEIVNEQLAPIVEALQRELATTAAAAAPAEIGVYSALQHALHARFPQAWAALRASKPVDAAAIEAKSMIDLYQAEDDVFRLAAWLKAKEGGATDPEAGKVARRSFMDYSINAPWIAALRGSALPFVSYTYRALPMLLETAGKRPHKLMKLMLVAGALNALFSSIGGGDDDDERKLLPEEKAGKVWGIVPKLIRMPWNDKNGSPVFLDIRRWIPLGDVFDVGQGHSALPLPPALMPGGPLVILGEILFNRSAFTGKPIVLEGTDTATEWAAKLADHAWKAAAPNIAFLPGTYAWQGVADAARGKTDAFGREQSVAQALASSVGFKLGSYPADVLRRNLEARAKSQIAEIDQVLAGLKRQRMTNSIDQDEYEAAVRYQREKQRKVMDELRERVD